MQKVNAALTETWDKFYTVYMFDDIKYHKLCKEQPNTDRESLKLQCYVKDEYGKRIHLGDQKHIFRIRSLHKIQEELAEYCKDLRSKIDFFDNDGSSAIETEYFTLYYEYFAKGSYTYGAESESKANEHTPQLSLFNIESKANEYKILKPWSYFEVELKGSCNKSIKERISSHLGCLALCKQGFSLNEAAKSVLENSKV